MAEERTIRVTGRGELRVKPDTVRLTLTIGRTEPDFAAAVDAAEKASAAAVAALAEAGAAGKDVRALSLRTEPHYETIADENGVRTRKFSGYSAVRRIRAELGTDPAALGRALTLLAACGAAPEIATEYTRKDEDALRGELLALAVKDAKRRAKAIAKAAGVKLGNMLTAENGGHGMPVARAAVLRMDSAELEPEDIVLSDEVTVLFEID